MAAPPGVCSFFGNCLAQQKTEHVGATESKVWIGNFNINARKNYGVHSPTSLTQHTILQNLQKQNKLTPDQLGALRSKRHFRDMFR